MTTHMSLEDFASAMRALPNAITDHDRDSLDQSGEAVADLARSRVPVRSGAMLLSIFSRRLHLNTQQIGSNHPGARVNEQDFRRVHPPTHWLTTSLIDSMPVIRNLFRDGVRDAINAVLHR
jgi:hypothetical protein